MSKIRDEVLELEVRREIFEFITRFPGLHMREIQRKLGLSIALAEYHLNFLEKADFVSSIDEGGYRRYYAKSGKGDDAGYALGHHERKIVGLLRQKIPLQIALFLLKTGQASHKDISDSLGMAGSKLSFHLKKMEGLGVIRKLKRMEGRGYTIEDRAKVLRLLITFKPSQDMLDEFSDLWDGLDPF
jgi:predicted transcriptional regulator